MRVRFATTPTPSSRCNLTRPLRLVAGTRQADDEAPPPQHGILAERRPHVLPYRVQRQIERRRLQRGAEAQVEAERSSLRRVGEVKPGRSVAGVGSRGGRPSGRLGRKFLRSCPARGDGVATDRVPPDHYARVC